MSGLSDEDRESLQRVFAGRSTMPSELAPTVEAIVTHAVKEALTEAADAIDAATDLGPIDGPFVTRSAAARIVRARTT